MSTITLAEFNYASHQISEGRRQLSRIEELLEGADGEIGDREWRAFLDAQKIIRESQFCIEIAVKSMFKLVGVEPPREHGLDLEDDRVEGLLRNLPDNFDDSDLVPRAIFLTQFWNEFYLEAKYGAPEINVTPIDLITETDALRAAEDAEFCLDMAEKLRAAVQKEMEAKEVDFDEFEFLE